MTRKYDIFETNEGFIAVVIGPKGIVRTTLPEKSFELTCQNALPEIEDAEHNPDALKSIREKIEHYIDGDNVDLTTLKIDIGNATPFFQQVWRACRTIERGEVRSYAWLAGSAGNPRAIRATGQAMARNRLPLIVPCHRVINSEGKLHGFGGTRGLTLKEQLLKMEGAQVR